MFHLSAYNLVAAGAVAFQDAVAAVDQTFTQQNSHLIFTAKMKLLAACMFGATVIDARLNMPSINATSLHHVYPPNQSATIPTNVQVDDYRASPIPIPENEEMAWAMSTGAAETDTLLLWLGDPNWSPLLPNGGQRLNIRCTATANTGARSWGADAALTFEQRPRGGVYAVLGVDLFEAATFAFRMNFPSARMYGGKKLFPGGLARQSIGLVPWDKGRNAFGEWGRFHTFEPPTIQVFSNAAIVGAQTINMDVIYLGESPSLLNG